MLLMLLLLLLMMLLLMLLLLLLLLLIDKTDFGLTLMAETKLSPRLSRNLNL